MCMVIVCYLSMNYDQLSIGYSTIETKEALGKNQSNINAQPMVK